MTAASRWFQAIFIDLARQMRWSYLPPLMVYFAAGCSGLTLIVGTFFVKDYLDLSAAEVAALAFWAGLPWALKMPLGHLVDLIWRWKGALIFLGAGLVGLSVFIMFLVMTRTEMMQAIMPLRAWYVTSYILGPCGLVIQDAVADAMSIDAVPLTHEDGTPLPEDEAKALHTTMQTLGRFAIISGLVAVGLLNLSLFAGVEEMTQEDRVATYARVYLMALAIPAISVSGVVLGLVIQARRAAQMRRQGLSQAAIDRALQRPEAGAEPDWQIFGGAAVFVAVTLGLGVSAFPFAAEIVFVATLAVVLFLIARLGRQLPAGQARALAGTAAIIFVFRAVPLPGPGLGWFEIDELGFDERFLAVLSLITSGLTLFGLVVLRPLMARWSIARIVVLLTLAGGVLTLPNIGLYYGLHEWTAPRTGGVVDARFIAILDTAIESPLGQVAMIPMLAWIARNAPQNLKATFFAVMASFTNLALSASSLGTKYLNRLFVVTRETETVAADYSQLGVLLFVVTGIGVAAPLLAVAVVQASRFRTSD